MGPHVRTHHYGYKWPCTIPGCSAKGEFGIFQKLKEHYRMVHELGKYSCKQCDFYSSTRVELLDHKREHQFAQEPETMIIVDTVTPIATKPSVREIGVYCYDEKCDELLPTREDLHQHMKSLHKKSYYECLHPNCPEIFDSE